MKKLTLNIFIQFIQKSTSSLNWLETRPCRAAEKRGWGRGRGHADTRRGQLKNDRVSYIDYSKHKKDFNQCDKNLVHLKLSKKHFTSGIYN